MTLDTRIVATTPCDAHDVFHEMRRLLGADGRHPIRDRDRSTLMFRHRDGYDALIYPEDDGVWEIGHPPGVGLDALLSITYRPGLEPRRTPEEAAEHEDWCDDDCDSTQHSPACWVEISIDTAYGYRGPGGEACGALHARLVYELGSWFEERRVGWGWRNEFTGEWHYEDRYAALKELINRGGAAMAWFAEVVQPIIESSRVKA